MALYSEFSKTEIHIRCPEIELSLGHLLSPPYHWINLVEQNQIKKRGGEASRKWKIHFRCPLFFNRPMVSQCRLEFDWYFHYLPTMHGRSRIEHKCLRKRPLARNTPLFASHRVLYIMPDIGNWLEQRQQIARPDIEILVVLMLVRLTWVLLILEIGGDGWKLSTGEPWSKNDGNIRSRRSKLSSLILRGVWSRRPIHLSLKNNFH